MEERMGLRALAFLRAIVGLWLLWLVVPNLDHSFIESLSGKLDLFAQSNPYPFYRWLIHNVAAPHIEQLGTVLSVGQLVVGAALLIGFLTRIVSGLGAFYALNLLFAAGHLSYYHHSVAVLLLVVFATFIIGDAGRFYGADGFLFKREEAALPPKKVKFKNKKQKKVVENLTKQLKKQTSKNKKEKSPTR